MIKKSNKYTYIQGKQITDAGTGIRHYDFQGIRLPSVTTILAKTKEIREQREAFINRLRLTFHTSSRVITTEYIPLIRFLIKHDKKFAKDFVEALIKLGYNVETIEKILNIEFPKEEVKVTKRRKG